MADEARPAPRQRRCPICGKPAAAAPLRPFCSERCRQVDLGRWLSGDYAIPTDPELEGEEQEKG